MSVHYTHQWMRKASQSVRPPLMLNALPTGGYALGGLSRLGTLTDEEVNKLSQVFRQEYNQMIQSHKITPEAEYFFRVMTALGDLFDPLTTDNPNTGVVDKLFRRVKEAFGGES
jgi:hypothetical protein